MCLQSAGSSRLPERVTKVASPFSLITQQDGPGLFTLKVTAGFPREARADKPHAQELSKSLRLPQLLLGHWPNQITWPIPDGETDWAS